MKNESSTEGEEEKEELISNLIKQKNKSLFAS